MRATKPFCLGIFMFLGTAILLGYPTVSGQTINDANYNMNLYYTIANSGTGGAGANDLAIGNGGMFGNDLYAADFGNFTSGDGNGRVWRITDSNNDGIGEGSVFVTAVGTPFRSPISLTFGQGGGSGFGDNLFLLDYSGSTSNRFVYEVDGLGNISQKSTSTIFNPDGLEAHPDGQRLLVNDASAFTVFGGGDDGNILQVSTSGIVSVWANGSNNPNGLWDINNEAVFSPDGWYTLSNHSVGASNAREIVQFKDLNSDGDANDAGESRVLIGLGAPIGQQAGFGFDENGNFLHSTGNDLYRYTDLNNDGDFWDASGNTFDAGERFLLAEDLGTGIKAIAFEGSTYYVSAHESGGSTSIYRISSAIPEPTSATLLLGLSVCICSTIRRRRRVRK